MKPKQIIMVIGWAFLFSSAITMFWTFMNAYFSGNYQVLVTINDHHEAHVELVMFIIGFPLAIFYLFSNKRPVEVKNDTRRKR